MLCIPAQHPIPPLGSGCLPSCLLIRLQLGGHRIQLLLQLWRQLNT
jgi:hypothetical protein